MAQRMSARFLAEIQTSHRVYSYVDITPPDHSTVRLPVFTGAVNVDRTAQHRRAANMVAVDPTGALTPVGNAGALTPYGTEIRPYRGVMYDDGTTEVAPLGVFRLSKNAVVEAGASGNPGGGSYTGVTYSLEMFDRSRTVSRDKFTVPYSIPIGTNVVSAIKLILKRTFQTLNYDAMSSSVVTTAPQVYNVGDDPWVAVTTLGFSIGCEVYFDADGDVVIAPPVDVNSLPQPDYTYIEGQDCTMTDLSAIYSDDPGFNGVIVTGASVGTGTAPVQATAWDKEPTSPTYYLGSYGKVPTFVTDSNITTLAQAKAAAQSALNGMIGFSAKLSLVAMVNPSFEAGDTIKVVRSPLSVNGLYTIDAFNVPLGGQIAGYSQSLTLRQKQKRGGA